MKLLALALVVCACVERVQPVPLARELTVIRNASEHGRELAVRGWKLSPAAWKRVVVAPYDAVYADYARAFDAAAPALIAQLALAGDFAVRGHFAGDPQLTRGQARARWALPVQASADVAMQGLQPVDAVFVRVDGHWRAIVGLDDIVVARTRALDAACASHLETLGAKGCQEVGWLVADAALRGERSRLAHACSLASAQCAR